MVTTAAPRLKAIVSRLLLALIVLIIAYPLAAWAGSSIPANSGWDEPATGIDIMVETEGSHTGIVVPIANSTIDWRETFPHIAASHPDGSDYTHLSLSWGEREVFLKVAQWGDLKARTVLRIAVLGGEPVMRVMPYVRPAPSAYHRPLRITPDQYRALVDAVLAGLPDVPDGGTRKVLSGSNPAASYYDATGKYTLITTCNSWTGDVLEDAGITVGRWTPFAGGVMKWFPVPKQPDRHASWNKEHDWRL